MNISIFATLCIFVIYVITGLVFHKKKEKRNIVFLNLSFLCLFIILNIREPYSDLHVYLAYFHRFPLFSIQRLMSFDMEIMYKFFSLGIYLINPNERFYIFVVDIITCIGPYFFIKKYSKNYFLSVLLFISIGTYFMQFYLIRQAIAISIVLLGIKFIDEKKFIKFFLIVLFASLFHTSALFFIVLYFLSYEKISKYSLYWFIIAVIIEFVFKNQLVSIISSTSYSNYLNSIHGVSGGGFGKLSLYLLVLIFNLFFEKKDNMDDRKKIIFKNMSFLYILVQIMATRVKIVGRLANYFCMGYIISTANTVADMKSKKNKLIFTLLIVIVDIIFLFFVNQISGYEIVTIYSN